MKGVYLSWFILTENDFSRNEKAYDKKAQNAEPYDIIFIVS